MKVKGTQDSNTLLGSSADDIIKGGRGNDHIAGGDGFDILYGGKGRDTFTIKKGDFDAIADFQPGKDKIIFDADLYGQGGGGLRAPDHIDFTHPTLYYEGTPIAVLSGVTALQDYDLLIS